MSIYIKGMEMPKKRSAWYAVHPNGVVEYNLNDGHGWKTSKAISIPSHGRLIDADRLLFVLGKNFGHTSGAKVVEQLINAAPTIIEAEEEQG